MVIINRCTFLFQRKTIRAQRFGDGVSTGSATAPSLPREGKLLERAKRFGLPFTPSVVATDEEKFKARADKFGKVAGAATTNITGITFESASATQLYFFHCKM